jgi:PII-like signaling protein
MDQQTDARLLRIFIGESDAYDGRPLYQAIVETLRREGMAGTTVLRGIEGFGKSSRLHAAHILRLSEDLPIVIECVDTDDKIEAVLPTLDAMIGDGLITLERVEVRVYRANGD